MENKCSFTGYWSVLNPFAEYPKLWSPNEFSPPLNSSCLLYYYVVKSANQGRVPKQDPLARGIKEDRRFKSDSVCACLRYNSGLLDRVLSNREGLPSAFTNWCLLEGIILTRVIGDAEETNSKGGGRWSESLITHTEELMRALDTVRIPDENQYALTQAINCLNIAVSDRLLRADEERGFFACEYTKTPALKRCLKDMPSVMYTSCHMLLYSCIRAQWERMGTDARTGTPNGFSMPLLPQSAGVNATMLYNDKQHVVSKPADDVLLGITWEQHMDTPFCSDTFVKYFPEQGWGPMFT